ncbi:hypothetical protein GOV04_03100 [Candidatus Woesearchaeota archaeon]|nr:hypothetical protein [Candidatus Woesearchaeota archaeon]
MSQQATKVLILILLTAVILFGPALAYNFEYVNVSTKVNVTNTGPSILQVIVNQGSNIVLNAGRTIAINCSVSILDYNGFGDIQGVNATFYYSLNASNQANDNNEHYNDSTCTEIDTDGNYANYTCIFDVEYYAFNGTWWCNATVIDDWNFTDIAWNSSTISSLYAINVTPGLLDFGNLSVGDNSTTIVANVTNWGNRNINVTVEGFGVTPGDGLAMDCPVENITIENLKFSLNASDTLNQRTNLTSGSALNVTNLTIISRLSDSTVTYNSTYWQLYVPPNPFGVCTGFIQFTASIA